MGDNTGVIGGAKGEKGIACPAEVGEVMLSEWRLVTEGTLRI
jgi:hypothetical protein